MVVPRNNFFVLEKKTDFSISIFKRKWCVAYISFNSDTQIESNSSDLRVIRISFTQHLSGDRNCLLALPDHATDWSWPNVFDEVVEKVFPFAVLVIFLKLVLLCLNEFHGVHLETLLLKSWYYFTYKTSLDSIRFDHEEGSLSRSSLIFLKCNILILIYHWQTLRSMYLDYSDSSDAVIFFLFNNYWNWWWNNKWVNFLNCVNIFVVPTNSRNVYPNWYAFLWSHFLLWSFDVTFLVLLWFGIHFVDIYFWQWLCFVPFNL